MEVTGNGAREALERWFDEAADFGHTQGTSPDQLLAWLWVEGFKIVPIDKGDHDKIERDKVRYGDPA